MFIVFFKPFWPHAHESAASHIFTTQGFDILGQTRTKHSENITIHQLEKQDTGNRLLHIKRTSLLRNIISSKK